MVRTVIQLTEEQMKALKELAKARHVSVAKLIRESVATYIVTAPKEPTMEEKRRRALAALDLIEKAGFHDREGKTDVSINHDKYFAESIL
jgi:stress response protein YsnF